MRYYRCGSCGGEIEMDHTIDNCTFCGSFDLSREVLGYIHQDPLVDEELNEPEDEYIEPPTE